MSADRSSVPDKVIAARFHHGGERAEDLATSCSLSVGAVKLLCRLYNKNATEHIWQQMHGGR